MKLVDLTGKRFNDLVVIEKVEGTSPPYWKCRCDCGNITVVKGGNLKHGLVKSCGCRLHRQRNTHHLSNTALYRKWNAIKRRCYEGSYSAYKNYGGRGITMCDEWKNDFLAFYKWAYDTGYKDGLTIERIDVNGNYTPDNCKWIPLSEQANNRRSCVIIEYNGKAQNLTEWCKEYNVRYKLVHDRMYKKGWDFERALLTPVDVAKRNKSFKGNS